MAQVSVSMKEALLRSGSALMSHCKKAIMISLSMQQIPKVTPVPQGQHQYSLIIMPPPSHLPIRWMAMSSILT